jgi:serine/threonine protein kinase
MERAYGDLFNRLQRLRTERAAGSDVLPGCVPSGLPVVAFLSIARGLASALEFMHSRRIVHRDLKSPNILLMSDG